MNVLVVYAHPEPSSFNGALKEAAVAALQAAGHQVQLSDLYAMNFDPVVRLSQFPERGNPEHFHLQREQRHAAETGTIAPDVAAEHAKLLWADLIILQFPIWWGSMPAIMKGWIERVFSVGTVYGRGTYALEGKRVLVSATGSAWEEYAEGAAFVTNELAHVFKNMLAFPKFQVLEPFYAFGAGQLDDEGRAALLKQFRERVLVVASGR